MKKFTIRYYLDYNISIGAKTSTLAEQICF